MGIVECIVTDLLASCGHKRTPVRAAQEGSRSRPAEHARELDSASLNIPFSGCSVAHRATVSRLLLDGFHVSDSSRDGSLGGSHTRSYRSYLAFRKQDPRWPL